MVLLLLYPMVIKCQKCSFEWNYTGKYKVKTTCPDCQLKTLIVLVDEV